MTTFINFNDLRNWVSDNATGSADHIETLAQHIHDMCSPNYGEDWTEFLKNLPDNLSELVPEVAEEDEIFSEPTDGDYITGNVRGCTDYGHWFQHGKLVLTTDADEWATGLQAHMDAEKYWPSAWYQLERGGYELLDVSNGSYAK